MARIGPAEVRERYGVEPKQVPDFIALRGDPSDKIPGAKGVGAIGAASLLGKYATLEDALADGRFAKQAKELRLYKKIATMDASAPLPKLPDQKPTWAKASALAKEWGLNGLSERLARTWRGELTEMGGTNWAGNLTYARGKFCRAEATVAEAQEAVRAATKLRVLGSRHCFNDIADTPRHASVAGKSSPHRLARQGPRARSRSRAACATATLARTLHAQGFALHNLASLPHISIAGACRHRDARLGRASAALRPRSRRSNSSTRKGDLVALSREKDGDTFAGAVVNLGALGVVTRLTLDIEPAFTVRQDLYQDLPLARARGALRRDHGGRLQRQPVHRLARRGDRAGLDQDARTDTFAARAVVLRRDGRRPKNLHPIATLDATNCTDQMGEAGPWFDRLPHFSIGFDAGERRGAAGRIFRAARARRRRRSRSLRALGRAPGAAPDDLGGAHHRRRRPLDEPVLSSSPCVAFHFSCREGLAGDARASARHGSGTSRRSSRARIGASSSPCPPAAVQARYPRLADFRDLLATHDPTRQIPQRLRGAICVWRGIAGAGAARGKPILLPPWPRRRPTGASPPFWRPMSSAIRA